MKLKFSVYIGIAAGIAGACLYAGAQSSVLPDNFPFPNAAGVLRTSNANGDIDLNNPFFQSLGTNGRSCVSCHQPGQGWSISAEGVRARFESTAGLDPIFRTNDGSNCNHDVDLSDVEGRRQAFSLLTSRGLIRIALPPPPNAEFVVSAVENPYGCNESDVLSMYRRPLPSTNLRFLSTVMWDGRESTPPSTEKITYPTNPADLLFDLSHQSLDATNGHAQAATPLTSDQQRQIVDFEMGLTTAQDQSFDAGPLFSQGAAGGPNALSSQQFFVGINDPLGHNPFGVPFTPSVFTLFGSWLNLEGNSPVESAKRSIARGERLFNSRQINITGVGGLNDDLGAPVIAGTCGTCHDAPNVGNHSFPAPLNIGLADPANPLGAGYLPVITLTNISTGEFVRTTDPGRALITGKWKDIGKVKGPILRGLASRAPYFHNGSATTLMDVVEFYNNRFAIGLTTQEKADLVAFLNAL
jgi:hypothetical protein